MTETEPIDIETELSICCNSICEVIEEELGLCIECGE